MSNSIEAFLDKAEDHLDKGEIEEAEKIFRSVLVVFPEDKRAVEGMQKILQEEAANPSPKLTPTQDEVHEMMGLYNQGRFQEVIQRAEETAQNSTPNVMLFNLIAAANSALKNLDLAIESFNKVLEINPKDATAYFNIGTIFLEKGEFGLAIKNYQKCLAINSNHAEAHDNMGSALKSQGNLTSAIEQFEQAIHLRPNFAQAHYNLGVALQAKGHLSESIKSYKKACEIKPDYFKSYHGIGNALKEQGKVGAAIDSYKQAIKIKPDYADAYNHMGLALMDKGDLEIAMETYKQAIKIDPKNADANINKAFLHLRLLDFEAGWLSYEWRWKMSKDRPQFLSTSKPLWQPSMRQRVLLWGEQGLGDEIMFASLILDMHSLSSQLIVQTDRRLVNLFKRSFPNNIDFRPCDEFVSETEYDAHMPFGSAPLYFRQTIESFKGTSEGWLSACSAKTKALRSELLWDDSETLIGISWHTTAHQNGAQNRLIPLNQIAQMLHAPKVRLVSLQYGDFMDEVEKLTTDYGIKVAQVHQIDNMNDIDGLAALISACDRIVSIDNATVHLAGALGKDTKVLLPYACEWRWGQSSQDSYWYDSVQLYRQIIISDWEHVIKKLSNPHKA